MWDALTDVSNYLKDYIVQYIDLDYTVWLTWVLTPLLITFLLPGMIVLLFYVTIIILYAYKWHRERLRDAYEMFTTHDFWNAARNTVAVLWDAHGWIWHGYELKGIDNIPENSGALIVYYHGAIPIDLYYMLAKVFLFKTKLVHTVADNFLFKIPGWKIISDAMKVIPGTIQSCAAIVKEGNVLAISPGGVYEAQFSRNYSLMWKKRLGFAKVALEAKAPIIPMFTENLREGFRTVNIGRRMWLKLYAWTKFPFAPVYGGFPVKMITHLGEPIPYDGTLTPEQLQTKVAKALEELIAKHQRQPGSITHALVERVYKKSKLSPEEDESSIDEQEHPEEVGLLHLH